MNKTFQEISEAIEATELNPHIKNAFGFMVEAFTLDGEYNTEADAVEALVDQLYQDKANISSIIKAVANLQTWVVIARLDGDETIILSQQVRAASEEEAEAAVLADLERGNPTLKGQFEHEYTHGPF